MTRFEEMGISKQEQAYTLKFAEKQFTYSCEQCCNKGLRHGPCMTCPVAHAHNEAIQAIMSGERKRPDLGYKKYIDKKGHVTLVVVTNRNVDTNIKVIIK